MPASVGASTIARQAPPGCAQLGYCPAVLTASPGAQRDPRRCPQTSLLPCSFFSARSVPHCDQIEQGGQ
eukprot:scaffold76211_cov17-Tisochrysis_lutea.AAC.1